MSTLAKAPPRITFEEFERLYAHSDRAFEYWHGKVVEKAVPTWLHSVLQAVLLQMLYEAGYFTGSETDLRLSREFAPRPDVMATRHAPQETRYPTQPQEVEIVVEVLSPDDTVAEVNQKCQEYVALGVAQIYVADPESQSAWMWNPERRQLDRVETWTLTNGHVITMADVWLQLQARSGRSKA